jgi:plasmid maintenance system killer protein
LFIGKDILLPITMEKGSGLAAQTFHEMTIIDAAGAPNLLTAMNVETRHFHHLSLADKAHETVMIEVNAQALPH